MTLSVAQFNPFELIPATALHGPRPLSHTGLEMWGVRLPQIPEMVPVPAFHESQLIVELEGAARVVGRVEQRFQTAVQPGMMFLIPNGTPTEWWFNNSHIVLNLFLTPTLLEQAGQDIKGCDPQRIEFVRRVAVTDTFVAAASQAMLHAVQHNPTADNLAAETIMYALIVHLLRRHTTLTTTAPPLSGKLPITTLGRVLDYIHSDLGQPLTLAELAHVAQLSPYHFARQFRATVGKPPHRYVLDQRLAAARRALVGLEQPIASVAAALGFADQSHLHYHFKRRFGVSPGAISRSK